MSRKPKCGAITEDSAAPTFDNTILALEKSGELLHRVQAAFSGVAGAYTNPALEKVQQNMAPRGAAHHDAIYLDPKLFHRVETVYNQRQALHLDPESIRPRPRVTYRDFLHAGAKLDPAGKVRLKEINAEESKLSNQFSRAAAGRNQGRCLHHDRTRRCSPA